MKQAQPGPQFSQNAIANLARASSRFSSRIELILDGHAAPHNLSAARWKVLAPIRAHGPKTVSQIARILGVVRQGVQRIVNELVDEGIVTLKPNPDHKTAKLVVITDKGMMLMMQTFRPFAQWANNIAQGFDEKELLRAAELLDELREKMELDLDK